MTAVPVTHAKLIAPRLPLHHVKRERLTNELITAAREYAAVMLIEPVGSGKTTFLSECYNYLRASGEHAAWLTLDASDNVAEHLWTHVAAAFAQAIDVESLPNDPTELSNALFEEYTRPEDRLVFVDDVDALEPAAMESFLMFIKRLLPDRLHVCVAGQRLPEQLRWFCLDDCVYMMHSRALRFTPSETSTYLEHCGIRASSNVVKRLDEMTDGWICGIRLCVEYTLDTSDAYDDVNVAADIAGTGNGIGTGNGAGSAPATLTMHESDCHVNPLHEQFFAKWIFSKLPHEYEEFLLETSFLEQLEADLCNSMCGRNDSLVLLDGLVDQGYFVKPTPGRHGWYYVHPMFLALLHSRARALPASLARKLNFHASEWFERHGDFISAARHMLLATDTDSLVGLTLSVLPNSDINSLDVTEWVFKYAFDEAKQDATCMLLLTWAYLMAGRTKETRFWCGHFKALVDTNDSMIAFALDTIDIKCMELDGAYNRAIERVYEAQDKFSDEANPWLTGILSLILAESYKAMGDFKSASEHALAAESISQGAGSPFQQYIARYVYISLHLVQGYIDRTQQLCYSAIEIVSEDSPVYGALYCLLARAQAMHNNLNIAEQSLKRASKRLSVTRNVELYITEHVTHAYIMCANGHLDASYEELARARANTEGYVKPLGSLLDIKMAQCNVCTYQGNLDEALTIWHELEDETNESDIEHYLPLQLLDVRLHLFSAVHRNNVNNARANVRSTICSMVCDEVDPDDLLEICRDVAESARAKDLNTVLCEALMIEAYILDATNRKSQALQSINVALQLGAKYGFVTLFANRRVFVRGLLQELLQQRKTAAAIRAFTRKLIAVFDVRDSTERELSGEPEVSVPICLQTLTERERDLVSALANGLTRKEIADALCISLNTVKTHLGNIFTKLGVNSKAELLELIDNE
ncbi:MAG: LuxR C-terminal-related transcriptional regulator [Coriobacteriales bacterium]|jgi:LuxR family maltose regulon positive regulatory protein|nr:LuxR C-terminal-related transcriptional regulator [Coriobacteriales bacterium]